MNNASNSGLDMEILAKILEISTSDLINGVVICSPPGPVFATALPCC